MPTNLYELTLKTLNQTTLTIAEGYMLARKIESFCENFNTFCLKVDDEGFRVETYFKADNGDLYYEEEHRLSVYTDGTISEFKIYKEQEYDEYTIELDRQGTVMEYLQEQLPDFTNIPNI